MLHENKNTSIYEAGWIERRERLPFDCEGDLDPAAPAVLKGTGDRTGRCRSTKPARTVFYGGIDRRPAVIVRVADAADVASRHLAGARDRDWSWPSAAAATASPGHSVSDGGIVLDLSRTCGRCRSMSSGRTAWARRA